MTTLRVPGTSKPKPAKKVARWLRLMGASGLLTLLAALAGNAQAQSNFGALSFDGVNDYVTMGVAPGLGASAFTLECWIKIDGAGATASSGTGGINVYPLIDKGRGEADGSNVDCNYIFGVQADYRLAADFEDLNNGLNHPVIGAIVLTTGVWHHCAVTYDGDYWRLYVDGVADTVLQVTGAVNVRTPRYDSIQHSALGTAMNSTGVASGFFKGRIDEARIWNYARTPTQITDNMNAQMASATGLIGRWSLNEASGTTATNTGSSAVNGTLVNGPAWAAGLLPSVAITSPANSATVGTNFTISASPMDVAAVTSVSFYDGATLLGSDTTSPYSYAWTGAPAGSHALTAVALYNDGLSLTSSTVGVTVGTGNVPPTVAITSPANNATVSTTFTINASAADSDGTVTSVSFYDGVTLLGTDTTSPYSYAWTGAPAGSHALTAVALDNGSVSTTSSVVNVTVVVPPILVGPSGSGTLTFDTLPSINQWSTLSVAGTSADVESDAALDTAMSGIAASSITTTLGTQAGSGTAGNAYWRSGDQKLGTQPTGNKMTLLMATLQNNSGGTINGLTVTYAFGLAAVTPGEAIKGHRVYWSQTGAAGSWTAVGDYLLTSPGTTTVNANLTSLAWANGGALYVVWVDDNGSTNPDGDFTLDNLSFTSTGPQPPTVSITSPANNATVGTSFTIDATASDSDGTVTSVSFYDGVTLLGTDTTSPYSYAWTGAPAGSHALTAVALDNSSASTTSATVTVNVNSNLPPSIVPSAPANEATGIGASTTLSTSLTDPESNATTVTFYGRKTTPAAPGPDFSLVAIPDTQFYSENTGRNPSAGGTGAVASIFNEQTQWIVDNRAGRNIAFVSHMGDIVQNGDFSGNPVEWNNADTAMKTIENPPDTLTAYGLPWGGAPGNHDFGTGGGSGTTTFYNQYFGSPRFAGRNYYGGHYGTNNNNNYQLFSASGLDFIVIHLEYNTGTLSSYQAVLDWADALLKAYPNRRAIVTSHWVVNTGNPASFSTQGQNIYNELKDNPNLFLMLCGHVTGEGRRTDVFTGHTVYSVLQDYQDIKNGGDGFLRIFNFAPASGQITVESYSPTLGRTVNAADLVTGWTPSYTLPYDMQSAVTDWIPLGTVNVAAGGTVASLSWTGLEAGGRYEWRAVVTDGVSTVTGATRRFSTTAAAAPAVALTSPANGSSSAPGPVNLTATASDADGSVVRVEFYDGATKLGEDEFAPYAFTWAAAPSGIHALTAVAVDNTGKATLSNVANVTVTGGSAPTITLTAPANNATANAPATINFAATAADSDGTVAKVEFYQGTFKVGQDTTAPYTLAWSNVAPGTYQLSAVAVDNVGFRTTSATVTNVVNAVASSGGLSRGPYLQKAAPTQMTVRWRSSLGTVGRVRYGTSVLNLSQFADEAAAPASPFNHVVTLTGLTAGTTYFYSVGSTADTLASGSDFTFTTPPLAGTVLDTRIWVLGDAGRADSNQTAVRDAFYTWTGARTPNLVLQLGDNAYNSGLDSEFQAGMFDIYPTMLRKTPFWSCLGNHETNQATAYVDTYPYFDIYTLPTAGECGGILSGTEHYYSFDYGNIHFICLDSMTASRAPTGAMAVWLQADLASTTATWIVCFFHHPPYTHGSHNSDTETELIEMRTNFLPILEAGGVDLVLTGHSHCYERSYLLDGHYGLSGTLTAAMKKNVGDGRPAGTGAYLKPLTGPRDHFGAVYAVAGSAGAATGVSTMPAHFISLSNLGSLVLDVNGTRLDATFVKSDGSTPDTFTIIKQGAADSDGDGIPDDYEIAHFLNRNNATDAPLDSDGDGDSNLKEFIFGTGSNVFDRYTFTTTYNSLAGTATVTFPTTTGRNYRVMYSGTLLSWLPASTSVAGTGGMMMWTDDGTTTVTPPASAGKRFYRIEVTVVP